MKKATNLTNMLNEIKNNTQKTRIIFTDINDNRVLGASNILLSEGEKPILIGKESDFKRYHDNSFITNNNYVANKDFYIIGESEDPITKSADLLTNGHIDGLVGGNISSTASVVRGLIKGPGTKQGITRVSSYFVIENKKGLFFIADCAIQAEPTANQLAEIALLTAQNAYSYGVIPKIAMLSFSTAGSAHHPMVEKMQEATKIAEKLLQESDIGEYIIEGDIQLDAAVKPGVWEKKNPDSQLKGEANILIFPNLDAGNIGYKAIDFFGDSLSVGPILQGLSKPGNDLSRGCNIDEIVAMYYITKGQIITCEKVI